MRECAAGACGDVSDREGRDGIKGIWAGRVCVAGSYCDGGRRAAMMTSMAVAVREEFGSIESTKSSRAGGGRL